MPFKIILDSSQNNWQILIDKRKVMYNRYVISRWKSSGDFNFDHDHDLQSTVKIFIWNPTFIYPENGMSKSNSMSYPILKLSILFRNKMYDPILKNNLDFEMVLKDMVQGKSKP